MILVIGGAFQGKRKAAAALFGMEEEEFTALCADGESSGMEEAFRSRFICGFHHYIRRQVNSGEPVESFVKQVIAAEPELVIMDEVGCGIVPMEAGERRYRDAAGVAGQLLAARAAAVYRVCCGISSQIR